MQKAVLRGTMVALTHIIQLNLAAHQTSGCEANGIPSSIARQSRAIRGIAEIAALAQFFRRRSLTFVAWSGAVASPSGSERQAGHMQP